MTRATSVMIQLMESIYEADNEALYNAGWKAQFLSGLMMPVLGFVGNLGYVAVAVTGAFFATRAEKLRMTGASGA